MEYLPRALEDKIEDLTHIFGAVLVTGPRQAGKTTLLENVSRKLFGTQIKTIAFDTPHEIDSFRRDPDLFFLNNPGRLFLDEVQHVPDIFPYLKRELDKNKGEFRFFITGSQHFALMKSVSESLAGRVGIFDLWPIAWQEITGADLSLTVKLLEKPSKIESLLGSEFPVNDSDDIVPAMLAGGYPPVALHNAGVDWIESYRRTYIQRDIRDLSRVADMGRFDRFMMLCAGRTGTIVNKADLSSTVGVDNKTVDNWMSLLESSYQILTLPAYFANTSKRLAKRPKWVFADSGLGLHLQAIRSGDSLMASSNFGHLFESFVIMEIRKLFGHTGTSWNGYHWRTPGRLECDLVLAAGNKLIPIEIKHTANPGKSDLRGIKAFREMYAETAAPGVIVSLNPRLERIAPDVINLPLGLIMNGL